MGIHIFTGPHSRNSEQITISVILIDFQTVYLNAHSFDLYFLNLVLIFSTACGYCVSLCRCFYWTKNSETAKLITDMQLTWQESLPPAEVPAQIMLLVMELPPYRELQTSLLTMGTVTSCNTSGWSPPVINTLEALIHWINIKTMSIHSRNSLIKPEKQIYINKHSSKWCFF